METIILVIVVVVFGIPMLGVIFNMLWPAVASLFQFLFFLALVIAGIVGAVLLGRKLLDLHEVEARKRQLNQEAEALRQAQYAELQLLYGQVLDARASHTETQSRLAASSAHQSISQHR